MVRFSNRLEAMKTTGLISIEIILKMINVEHTIADNKIYFDSDTLSLLID